MISQTETGAVLRETQDRTLRSALPDRFDELRELLVGREKFQLSRLAHRIENPVSRAEDVGEVLPAAVMRCAREDDRLARAMTPMVESALHASIRRDPAPMANALYPVIGSAIRKAIAETFSRFLQAFNHALENSFSPRGIRWRIEAWRTGRPFAEVVMCHTLVFRVEQVLLVHRPSGLLLLHATAPGIQAADQDLISGMLSAIQDFMRDSFHAGPGEHLQTVQIGELSLWIETGPHATLAAMVRGEPSVEFRQTLEQAIEGIHREESAALEAYSGDSVRFEALRPWLETCLQSQTMESPRKGLWTPALAVYAIALAALIVWGCLKWRERSRERALLAALRSEHGLVVNEMKRTGGKLRISGWRDPLSLNPAIHVAQAGIPTNAVEFQWEPFFGLSSDLTLRRARTRLEPPPGVDMVIREGTLVLSGAAPAAWAREAGQRALFVPGIERVEASGLRVEDSLAREIARVRQSIERAHILFERDRSSNTNAETVATLATIAKSVGELRELARVSGMRTAIAITGNTDLTGTENHNVKLRQRRAEWVRQQLAAGGVPGDAMRLVDSEAERRDIPEAAGALTNRSVTFNVLWQK